MILRALIPIFFTLLFIDNLFSIKDYDRDLVSNCYQKNCFSEDYIEALARDLRMACSDKNLSFVRNILTDYSYDRDVINKIINSRDALDKTPLIRVCNACKLSGDKDSIDCACIASLLIEFGAELNCFDINGSTALSWAISSNNIHLIGAILGSSKSIDVDKFGVVSGRPWCSPLYSCILSNDSCMVRLLLQKGANPNLANYEGKLPLVKAVEIGNVEIVGDLLHYGSDPKARYGGHPSPIVYAMSRRRPDILMLLLKKVESGDPILFDTDKFGCNLLMWAAKQGDLSLIRFLIDRGANIFHKDNSNRSVLFWAVRSGSVDVIKFLLSMGLFEHINDVDINGATVLAWSCAQGLHSIAELLIRNGADITISDKSGSSILINAIRSGSVETVRVIFKHIFAKKKFNLLSVISKHKSRTAFAWLLRMHPYAPRKNLNLYSKKNFNLLFKLFLSEEALHHIGLLNLDLYGHNMLYWLIRVADLANIKHLFYRLENSSNGNELALGLLNEIGANNLTVVDEVSFYFDWLFDKIHKKYPGLDSSGIDLDPYYESVWNIYVFLKEKKREYENFC